MNQIKMHKFVAYESGDMSKEEVISFFQELVDSGIAWKLQGSYGRMAQSLIESGDVTQSAPMTLCASINKRKSLTEPKE